MNDYESSLEGLRKFLEDVHSDLKSRYKTVPIEYFIDEVIRKIEQIQKEDTK